MCNLHGKPQRCRMHRSGENRQKKGDIRIICHDVAESTKLLLQDGSIDFTITQNLFRQGYVPLTLLRDYLQKKKLPESNGIATPISIICSQNIDQDYPPYNI